MWCDLIPQTRRKQFGAICCWVGQPAAYQGSRVMYGWWELKACRRLSSVNAALKWIISWESHFSTGSSYWIPNTSSCRSGAWLCLGDLMLYIILCSPLKLQVLEWQYILDLVIPVTPHLRVLWYQTIRDLSTHQSPLPGFLSISSCFCLIKTIKIHKIAFNFPKQFFL